MKKKIDPRIPTCPDCGEIMKLSENDPPNYGKIYECIDCEKTWGMKLLFDRNEQEEEEERPYCDHCDDYVGHETEEHVRVIGPLINKLPEYT